MIVAWNKPSFVGHERLREQKAHGVTRKLVGIEMIDRGIARHGHRVFVGDRLSGVVTSGTHSPTLGHAIAMAYVAPSDAEPGTMVAVEIRDQPVAAEVVQLPFYRRPR